MLYLLCDSLLRFDTPPAHLLHGDTRAMCCILQQGLLGWKEVQGTSAGPRSSVRHPSSNSLSNGGGNYHAGLHDCIWRFRPASVPELALVSVTRVLRASAKNLSRTRCFRSCVLRRNASCSAGTKGIVPLFQTACDVSKMKETLSCEFLWETFVPNGANRKCSYDNFGTKDWILPIPLNFHNNFWGKWAQVTS